MGVRVRLGRNSSAYFPFWIAIPFYMMYLMVVASVLGVVGMFWLSWAVIALPTAGIASLCHNQNLSHQMIQSLKWYKGNQKNRRRR